MLRRKLLPPQCNYCNFLWVQNYIDNLCFDKQMVLEILSRDNPLGKRYNPCYGCERSWIQIVSDLTIYSLNAPAQHQIYHSIPTYSQHKKINFTTTKWYDPQNVERTLHVGKMSLKRMLTPTEYWTSITNIETYPVNKFYLPLLIIPSIETIRSLKRFWQVMFNLREKAPLQKIHWFFVMIHLTNSWPSLEYESNHRRVQILYPQVHLDDACCYLQDYYMGSHQLQDQIRQMSSSTAPTGHHLAAAHLQGQSNSLSGLFAPTNSWQYFYLLLKSQPTQHSSKGYQVDVGLLLHHLSQRKEREDWCLLGTCLSRLRDGMLLCQPENNLSSSLSDLLPGIFSSKNHSKLEKIREN